MGCNTTGKKTEKARLKPACIFEEQQKRYRRLAGDNTTDEAEGVHRKAKLPRKESHFQNQPLKSQHQACS